MRTSEEMFPVVEDWLQSGLTQKAYSQQHQLPGHVLPYWVGRYRKTQPAADQKTSSFIRLATPAALPVHGMEVQLPSGVVIRFAQPVPVTYLQQVLSACLD